jgi:3-oxoacyl-(acyl-carrier-protein) synthase
MSGYVLGQAAWMPGRPDVAAVIEDRCVPGADAPAAGGYPSRLMRGTSMITRMSVAVALRALEGTGVDPRTVPAVFGSAYGEAAIAITQLEMMVTGDGQISPALFKNSVHNTGAGVFSIAHGNHTSSTSLAAGRLTVAYALLEALGMLEEGAPQVLVVVGDEALPQPLAELAQWESFAAAWVLGRDPPPAARPWVRLSELQALAAPAAEVPAALAIHPCRSAHALLTAIHRREPGRVSLGQEPDQEAWSVAVTVAPQEPPA